MILVATITGWPLYPWILQAEFTLIQYNHLYMLQQGFNQRWAQGGWWGVPHREL